MSRSPAGKRLPRCPEPLIPSCGDPAAGISNFELNFALVAHIERERGSRVSSVNDYKVTRRLKWRDAAHSEEYLRLFDAVLPFDGKHES